MSGIPYRHARQKSANWIIADLDTGVKPPVHPWDSDKAGAPQHASYIPAWIKPPREDKREVFHAAVDAQRIANLPLGFHPACPAQMEPRPKPPALPLGGPHRAAPAPP